MAGEAGCRQQIDSGFGTSVMAAPQAGRNVALYTHPVTSFFITLTLIGEAVTAFTWFLFNYSGLYLPPLITLAIGAQFGSGPGGQLAAGILEPRVKPRTRHRPTCSFLLGEHRAEEHRRFLGARRHGLCCRPGAIHRILGYSRRSFVDWPRQRAAHLRPIPRPSYPPCRWVSWCRVGLLSPLPPHARPPLCLAAANAALAHDSTTFSAAIEQYFSWPESWDVAGLSAAFSPRYAAGAWTPDAAATDSGVGFAAIAAKVAWPAFLWGVGTAVGELPPYFVARAAARVGSGGRGRGGLRGRPADPASLPSPGRRARLWRSWMR